MSGEGGGPAEEPRKGLAAVFDRPAPTQRQILLGGGHLAALWALAFVQPLLELLGNNPDFFVARGNTTGDILILAIGFTVVPPLVLLAVEWLVSKVNSKAYFGLHFLLMAGIATFIFVRLVADLIGGPSAVILLISFMIGVLLAWTVFRFVFAKNLLDILIVAPLVILLLFVFTSKTSDLIFPEGGDFELASDSGKNVPVVVMVYDELGTSNLMNSDGQIAADRFPNFARLAAEGTWYKNHSTNAFLTTKAVPGLLTGIDPPSEALPTWQEQPQSFFSQFGRDRQLHVMEPVTALCPDDLCPDPRGDQGQISRLKALYSDLKYVEGRLILPPGLAERLPDVGANFEGFGEETGPTQKAAPAKTKRGKRAVKPPSGSDPALYQQFIQQIPDSDRGLTMMHMHLPHQIWKYDLQGNLYNPTPIMQLSEGTGNWLVDSNGITTAQSRMYVQTGFADRLLGQMRKRLVSTGLWDKALVIVTADHGISFEGGDVPQRIVDKRAMGEVANPPLFIKYPGQKAGVTSNRHSMSLDVVPTIAETLGVKDLYETEGVPLQGTIPERDVTVTDGKGRPYTIAVEEMVRQRQAALARAEQRLGDGPFYTLGPAPQLVGRPVKPVPAGTSEISLDQPGRAKNYRPGNGPIPMFVSGTWSGSLPEDPAEAPIFAIAVNGTVQATARPFEFDGAIRWGALVDPASLRAGDNRIGVYRLEGDQLIPLGGN